MILSDKGVKIGFAVNNRKKNQATGQYEDDPVFIDCEMWNFAPSNQATRLFGTVKKGGQLYIEGHLKYDTWEDKNGGGKRHAMRLVVDHFQYLDAKEGVNGGNNGAYQQIRSPGAAVPALESAESYSPGAGGEQDIPF